MTKTDKYDRELLESIDRGEWKKIDNMDETIKEHSEYARRALRKDKRINIRICSRDLELIQKKALVEGIPYQTLISSILHKYANA